MNFTGDTRELQREHDRHIAAARMDCICASKLRKALLDIVRYPFNNPYALRSIAVDALRELDGIAVSTGAAGTFVIDNTTLQREPPVEEDPRCVGDRGI